MVGRLIKIIVFTFIVCYFLFYKYNVSDVEINEMHMVPLTTLLLQEQQILKTLELDSHQLITIEVIEANNVPYVEGKLLQISQLTDQIVLAQVKVINSYEVKLKKNEIINIAYTGYLINETTPLVNNTYRWLIQKQDKNEPYYYIQGGLKGILAY